MATTVITKSSLNVTGQIAGATVAAGANQLLYTCPANSYGVVSLIAHIDAALVATASVTFKLNGTPIANFEWAANKFTSSSISYVSTPSVLTLPGIYVGPTGTLTVSFSFFGTIGTTIIAAQGVQFTNT